MKILIADDDQQILRALRITLTAKKYTIITAADGTAALNAAIEHQPDLFLLDLGMPGLDGVEVIQGIRGWSQAPILVLSGRTSAMDKVKALDAGADDYITKPFSIEELLARLRALARRIRSDGTAPVVTLGSVTVDLAARIVTRVQGDVIKSISLTPTEWQVLEILIRNAGRVVTRQDLLTAIWGTEHALDSGYLRLYISQLRKKIEANPAKPVFISTASGIGYRLDGIS